MKITDIAKQFSPPFPTNSFFLLTDPDDPEPSEQLGKALASDVVGSGQPGGGSIEIVTFFDRKPQGTSGGSFTSGADRTRDINLLVPSDLSWISLDQNQLTLQPGSYLVHVECPVYNTYAHQSLLYSVSDSSIIIRGGSMYTASSTGTMGISIINAHLNLSNEKTFEIRHRCSSSHSTGFGNAANFGDEVYTQGVIIKYA